MTMQVLMQVLWHFDRENEVHLVRYDEMITAWVEALAPGTEFTVFEVTRALRASVDQDIAQRPNPHDYDRDIVRQGGGWCQSFEDEVHAVTGVLELYDEATPERRRSGRPIYVRSVDPRLQDMNGLLDLRYQRV